MRSYRLMLTAGLLAASIAAVDAALNTQNDLFILILAADVILLVALLRTVGRRQQVAVRADLATWLEERAAGTGQPIERLADRALATYRDLVEPARTGVAGERIASPGADRE